jgi:hypothetical protein
MSASVEFSQMAARAASGRLLPSMCRAPMGRIPMDTAPRRLSLYRLHFAVGPPYEVLGGLITVRDSRIERSEDSLPRRTSALAAPLTIGR